MPDLEAHIVALENATLAERAPYGARLKALIEQGRAGIGQIPAQRPQAPAVHIGCPEAAKSPANLFAQPSKLDVALQQSEAAYAERVQRLEQLGVLVAGKLPLIAPVRIGDKNVDALPFTPWGQMADTIRRDETLRRALAALDAPHGIPLIQPDLRAGSLQRQIQVGGMEVYPTFDLERDAAGSLIPFGFDEATLTAILKMDDEARRAAFEALAKKFLLESGRLHTDGYLGLSFMDAGAEVPRHTLGMNMFNAAADARQHGLHVVAPENYVGAQQIADTKFGQNVWTWLNGFDAKAGLVLFADWRRRYDSELSLRRVGPWFSRPGLGSRREARASGKGLEI